MKRSRVEHPSLHSYFPGALSVNLAMNSFLVLALSIACLMPLVLSTKECLMGEKFWCSSFENAVTCSAVKFCTTEGWKTGKEMKEETISVGEDCRACVDFMSDVSTYLGDPDSKESIKSRAVDSLCQSFGVGQNLCRDVFTDVVENVFIASFPISDPFAACRKFDYCTIDHQQDVVEEGDNVEPNKKKLCKFCKKAMDAVKRAIGSKPTRKIIEKELDKVCYFMPPYFRKECKQLINKHVNKLIDQFINKTSSEKICASIKLCAKSSSHDRFEALPLTIVQKETSPTEPNKKVFCKFCKKAMDAVKRAIGSSPTRELIEHELDKVCDFMPAFFVKECKKIINENIDKLIDQFMNNVSSEKICASIKLCSVPSCSEDEGSSNLCEACEIVARFVEDLAGENSTSEPILRSTLSGACPFLPCKYQESCFSFNKNFGEDALKLFLDGVEPDRICSLMSVCDAEEYQGSHFRCIAGPNFWCSSPVNAELCEAEDYCRKYYWI